MIDMAGLGSNDKDRMFRNPKLSVKELEILVQLVSDEKTRRFRQGDKVRTEELQHLQEKLQKTIIKE